MAELRDGAADRVRVRRRSIEADLKRAEKVVRQHVDEETMKVARQAHLDGRHDGHPGDFDRLCVLCRTYLVRKHRREKMEAQGG